MFTQRLVSRLPPQVGSAEVPLPAEVKVDLQATWHLEEEERMMMVDSQEDNWRWLHDIRASGMVCLSPQ